MKKYLNGKNQNVNQNVLSIIVFQSTDVFLSFKRLLKNVQHLFEVLITLSQLMTKEEKDKKSNQPSPFNCSPTGHDMCWQECAFGLLK